MAENGSTPSSGQGDEVGAIWVTGAEPPSADSTAVGHHRHRLIGVVALVGLLMAIVASTGTGLLYLQNKNLVRDLAAANQAVATLESNQISPETIGTAFAETVDPLAGRVDDLERAVNDVEDSVWGFPGAPALPVGGTIDERLTELEGSGPADWSLQSRVMMLESDVRSLCTTLQINTDLIITC